MAGLTGCSWPVTDNQPWITTPSTVSAGTMTVRVGENTGSTTRSGTVTIGTSGTVVIRQPPPTPPNRPPVAVDDTATTTQNTPLSVSVLANDSDPDPGDSLRVAAVVSGPGHGATVISGGAQTITYTPSSNWTGVDTFRYRVTDNHGATDVATVTVTVTEITTPNRPPVAVDDTATTTQNTSVSVSVLANDRDPDPGDSLRVAAVVSGPGHGATVISGDAQTITYTPSSNWTGVDTFRYRVTDNHGATDVATVTVTVTEIPTPNRPPVAVDDTATTTQNTPLSVPVLANDTDSDGDSLRVDAIVTPPTQGTAVASPDGQTITYTPPLNATAQVTFRYRVADGRGGTAAATVTVTVVDGDFFGPQCLNPLFAPVARAGTDQTWTPGTLVTLDGSSSFDRESCPLAYSWARDSGPHVTLSRLTAAKSTFTVPLDAADGTEWVFELTVRHEHNSPHSATDSVRVTVAADALSLNARRDLLVRNWAAGIDKARYVCEAWHSLHQSARNVFIWNTHRLNRSDLLREVTALHAVFGTDSVRSCGGEEYNRTFMSMTNSLQDKLLAEARQSSSDPLLAWRYTQDPKGAHIPYMFSVETHDSNPRGQIHFFHRDWIRVLRTFNDTCIPVRRDIRRTDRCTADACPGSRLIPVPPGPEAPDWRDYCPGDQYTDTLIMDPANPDGPPLVARGPDHEVVLGGSEAGAAIFEMDQDYNQFWFQFHDSAPVCWKYAGVPLQLVEVDKRDTYTREYGDPEWVRLFFVDGPRGFCQRHGKSYLTRRRRGGEGGGGGLLTGCAIPSAYRWAWCRWYSRVVEVPVRIEVAAGFVAPGASEPPRLQPSWPLGGSRPAHG